MSLSHLFTLAPITGGLVGTAPAVFTASTNDDDTALVQPGYLNEFYDRKQIKERDWIFINYDSGKQSNLFLVKNTAKEHETPTLQLIKIGDLV